MKTKELIAALQGADPESDVFVYHAEADDDYVITCIKASAKGDVMLDVGLACSVCKHESADEDDGWDGLCPSCADLVSECMDVRGLNRDEAIAVIGDTFEEVP